MSALLQASALPSTVELLLEYLQSNRVLTDRQIDELKVVCPSEPFDAVLWINWLVANAVLTPFQAEMLLDGRTDALVLGQYRIIDRLGQGGMGQVYKAEHSIMKRVVALKLIAPHLVEDGQVLAHFHREVQLAAQLSHPNIVAVYDAAEANGVHFFVMEYVDGVDLGRQVKGLGPVPVALACEYTRQAALGLQHAHEKGLVHCDIKPANLLVRRPFQASPSRPTLSWTDGVLEPPLVKILDFGVARLAQSTADADSGFAGTPDFMAPEQANNEQQADIRSDLYSLGCTFYYLLTGQVPFPGGTWTSKLLHHQFDQPTPMTEARPEVPAEVALIVQRLMAKEPGQRYQTPLELATRLQQWLASEGNPFGSELTAEGNPFESEPTDLAAAPLSTDCALDSGTVPSSPLTGVQPATSVKVASVTEQPGPSKPCLEGVSRGRRWKYPTWPVLVSAVAAGLLVALITRPATRLAPALAEAGSAPIHEKAASAIEPPRVGTGERPDPLPTRLSERLFQLKSSAATRFARLEGAIAAAQDGDTIVIHGDGPFPTRPIAVQGKALTIRAEPGYRPRIVFVPEKDDPIWQPLLTSDRDLTLEGLDLCEQPGTMDPDKPKTTHLVYCEHAELRLKRCCLLAPHSCALVVCRRPPRLEMQDCTIVAHTAALCIEAGSNSGSEINLRGNRIAIQGARGTALSLWEAKTSRPAVVRLHIEDSRVQADRIIALTGTTSEIEMSARSNQFEFNKALLGCTGFTDAHSWRSVTGWHGENNHYHGTGNWVSVDGKNAGIQNLKAWSELWHSTEAGSSEGSALSTSEPSLSAATHQAAFSK